MSSVASTATDRTPIRERIRYWLPAVAVFAIGIATWQWVLPDLMNVEAFVLPRFSDVLNALWDERAMLARGAWITFKEALGGLVIGSSVAFVSALVLARWRPFGTR